MLYPEIQFRVQNCYVEIKRWSYADVKINLIRLGYTDHAHKLVTKLKRSNTYLSI